MSCIYVETKTNKYPIYFKNGFSDLKTAVEAIREYLDDLKKNNG